MAKAGPEASSADGLSADVAQVPRISVIVVAYRMRRQVPRTLASLHSSYQRVGSHVFDIELAEMPSDRMLKVEDLDDAPANLTHTVEAENLPLPVAVNRAVRRTRGAHVLLCVDGSRILSPGVLSRCLQVAKFNPRAMLAVHGLHLGSESQQVAVPERRHSPEIEDRLLREIDFPKRPNQLFQIACWEGSSEFGWFGNLAESCAFFVPREYFESLGGFDERVTTPGGGLANSDFYTRATADPTRPLFIALGEATFHQCNGGATTNRKPGGWGELKSSFEEQTGREFVMASPRGGVQYLGTVPIQARALAIGSLLATLRAEEGNAPAGGIGAVRRAEARMTEPAERTAPRAPMTLVVGMHRSGTSFITRQLVQGGLIVPGTPMGGSPRSNPEGHYEPLELVAFHNRLLKDAGRSWSALGTVDPERPGNRTAEWHARHLHRLLLDLDARDTPEEHSGWVVKDPRICRTLPVWQRAIALMGVQPAMLLILRDPTLVAESLQRRDGFDLDFGRLLWARYVCDMLALVKHEGDLICLDATDAETLAAHVAQRTGLSLSCEPIRHRPLRPAEDPLTSIYRAFLADRDLDALKAGLAAEIAFLDRYPSVVRRLDRFAGLADTRVEPPP